MRVIIHIFRDIYVFMSEVPQILIDTVDALDPTPSATTSSKRSISSSTSLYSEGALSDDSELRNSSKSDRFKGLLKISKKTRPQYSFSSEEQFYNDLRELLQSYRRQKDVNWEALAEQCLFGDIIDVLFHPRYTYSNDTGEQAYSILKKKGDNIMCHLLKVPGDSTYDELRFIFPHIDVEFISNDSLVQILKTHVKDLDSLDQVLDLYAKNANTTSGRLLEILTRLARGSTLPIPLAQTMLASWLLSYKRSGDDESVMGYHWSAARISLLYKNLVEIGYFNEVLNGDNFDSHELIMLNRFFTKDCRSALGISLFNIGQYLQMHHDCDMATDIWEIGAHVSGDNDCCNMGIWGLMDGFGSANIKGVNRLSSKYKECKFVSKRRIAHLYRILIDSGASSDIGTSWVWKSKYD